MTLTILGRRIEVASPVRIRRADTCTACGDRGLWYSVGSIGNMPPPAGCTGVFLCACGAAEHNARASRRTIRRTHRRAAFYSRMGWRRRILLAVTLGRVGRDKAPF